MNASTWGSTGGGCPAIPARWRPICGSCAATCATMGTISIPEMRKYGYNDRLATGSIAMGGTLGILIPPSTPMIIYCIMVTEASIGASSPSNCGMFMANSALRLPPALPPMNGQEKRPDS